MQKLAGKLPLHTFCVWLFNCSDRSPSAGMAESQEDLKEHMH